MTNAAAMPMPTMMTGMMNPMMMPMPGMTNGMLTMMMPMMCRLTCERLRLSQGVRPARRQ